MRRLIRVLVLVLVVVLGCSPEPPPAPSSAPTARAQTATPAQPGSVTPTPTPQARVRRPLRYVALGDSLASGMAAINGGRSYADAYAQMLRRRTAREVKLDNLGVPGLTSAELLDSLRHNADVRAAVSKADIVTWDIGGNDLIETAVQIAAGNCGGSDGLACLPQARDEFEQRWTAIVDELATLRRSPRVRLQTFTLYRPFATVRGVREDALLAELDARNDIILDSQGQHGVQVADVADTFADGQQSDLIDDDGLHPTQAGHRVIARELLSLER